MLAVWYLASYALFSWREVIGGEKEYASDSDSVLGAEDHRPLRIGALASITLEVSETAATIGSSVLSLFSFAGDCDHTEVDVSSGSPRAWLVNRRRTPSPLAGQFCSCIPAVVSPFVGTILGLPK